MMCHYPDLCSASDWYIKASFPLGMTNQKALPLGGGGLLGEVFAGYVPLPLPQYSLFCYQYYRPHLSHLWANM